MAILKSQKTVVDSLEEKCLITGLLEASLRCTVLSCFLHYSSRIINNILSRKIFFFQFYSHSVNLFLSFVPILHSSMLHIIILSWTGNPATKRTSYVFLTNIIFFSFTSISAMRGSPTSKLLLLCSIC